LKTNYSFTFSEDAKLPTIMLAFVVFIMYAAEALAQKVNIQ
jgi:hypothetical protein